MCTFLLALLQAHVLLSPVAIQEMPQLTSWTAEPVLGVTLRVSNILKKCNTLQHHVPVGGDSAGMSSSANTTVEAVLGHSSRVESTSRSCTNIQVTGLVNV